MAAFQMAVNRITMNYSEDVNLSDYEKLMHAYRVLRKWPSARNQLHLENIYNSERGMDLGEKLLSNQQYHTLSVYNKLSTETETILESILEWEGSFDEFVKDMYSRIPLFPSVDLDSIEKELKRSAQEHHSAKRNRYILKLLQLINESDISSYEDLQPSSLECTVTSQKYVGTSMDELFDSFPLPTNIKEVERQSAGKNFHFLRAINPSHIAREISDSLDCANSFWDIPDIKNQLSKFTDEWAYDRKFNSRYYLNFVDCLHELNWIRGRMLAAKNMNAISQTIFWKEIDLKNNSNVIWLFNWCKKKPSIFQNIVHESVRLLTEHNESESVIFSLQDFLDLEFKSWLCICEHEYLKLVKVTLFDKLIDHNLIYDHDIFECQELIYSGMLRINLAILKFFVDDRNSFTIEERKNLGLHQITKAKEMKQQIVSQHNDEVKTDALDTNSINTQTNDQIPVNTQNIPSMPITSQQALLQQSTYAPTQVQELERKNISTRVIDETTLRISFPSNPNAEFLFPRADNTRFAVDFLKGQDMATSTRGLPMLSIAPSLSLPTIINMILSGFYFNFSCKTSRQELSRQVYFW